MNFYHVIFQADLDFRCIDVGVFQIGINMDKFPEFTSDVDFTEKLVTEQSVFALPASVS